MNAPRNSELGRALKADELEPGKIVCTNSERWPNSFFTFWVERVDERMVWILSAMPGKDELHIGLFRQDDGSLKDGGDKTVRIFEYLGEYPKSDEVHNRN